jgi:Flp pilus assembly protein TadG
MACGPIVFRRFAAAQSGSAVVEFALLFPVLTMVIFGAWYTGWAINCGGEVRHAVELGSRIYITNPGATKSDLQTAVASHLISVPISAVTLDAAQQTIGTATSEHITWSYQTSAPIPFIPAAGYNLAGSYDVPLATS